MSGTGSPRWCAAVAIALAGLFGLGAGCASRSDDGPDRRVTELPAPGPELSQELMLGLSLARNYHHKADVYLKEAKVEQAIASVRDILTIRFPTGSPEGEDVVHDARARLAKLLVTRGALDEAQKVVDQGIAGASRQSFFLANLHAVRGEVMEARAAQSDESDAAAATAARRQAIESYDRAIAIEKALIDQLAKGDVE
jgi:tetratricopeptide (TPR) repeat protein